MIMEKILNPDANIQKYFDILSKPTDILQISTLFLYFHELDP